MATQARDPAPHYEHSSIGYNFRLSNVCAGIGIGQLRVLEERVRQRRANYTFYKAHLGKLPGVLLVDEPAGHFSNRWLTTILLEPAGNQQINELIRVGLEADNIESRPLWKPMHLQPVFKDAPAYVSGVSERLFRTGLCLPSGSGLLEVQREEIVAKIASLLVTTTTSSR